VKHLTDVVVPRPSRRPRVVLAAAAVAGFLALTGCATPGGPAAPSPSSAASTTMPASSAPPTASTPSPTPSPSATAVTDEPFNGQILIVTSEVREGRLEVTAMLPKVAESGGVCTLTVPSTGASVTTEASEGKDVTYCGVMSIEVTGPVEDLAFMVSYESATTKAESSLTTVEPAA
jgi:hypothetical protein